MDTYYLMNKDKPMATFALKRTYGGDYEIIADKIFIDNIFTKDTEKTLLCRKPSKHRKHINKVLKLCGIVNIKGLIEYTHLTSLNDTVWVKKTDSDLYWRDVSLYMGDFDEVTAKTAFNGGMYGNTFSTTTPELSTSGTFAKCWIREDSRIYMKKKGSSGFANAGLEPFSEYYAQQVAQALQLEHVSYTLHKENDEYYTKCELFTSEKFGFMPASSYPIKSGISNLVDFYEKHNFGNHLREMFIFDAIIFNQDRHLGNFGFLIDNDTTKIVKPAPLFDHNMSLLCLAMRSDFDKNNCQDFIDTQGHKLVSGNYTQLAIDLMTPKLRKKLLDFKDFKLKKHSCHNLPDWRLDCLNRLMQKQVNDILKG